MTARKTLTLESNSNVMSDKPLTVDGNVVVMVTPPIGEDYWSVRVAVTGDQAIIGFPKFGTIGIGFQHEDKGWNTNLPYTCEAPEIYDHIKVNRRTASRATCIRAIKMIQTWAWTIRNPKLEEEADKMVEASRSKRSES